jgi:acetylornithine deacetylase/succinyl-diaminopimelate desuccinylase-like protein
MTLTIDEPYLTKLTQEFIRINSINPSLTPDGKGEVEIGTYVAEKLKELGLDVTTSEIAPGRVNAVGVLNCC